MADSNGVAVKEGSPAVPDSQVNGNSEPPLQPVPDAPQLSASADSDTKRPRDARLIHMILANLGVTAYQERVPLQLMDFAYRYTSATLQDAQHFVNSDNTTGNMSAQITLPAVRLAVASRLNYQFQPTLPKPFLMELAAEKNRIALPAIGKEWGLRLPPEKYCLTGTGFSLKEEWDTEGSEDEDAPAIISKTEDVDAMEDEDEDAQMEDLFGKQPNEEDEEMEDA